VSLWPHQFAPDGLWLLRVQGGRGRHSLLRRRRHAGFVMGVSLRDLGEACAALRAVRVVKVVGGRALQLRRVGKQRLLTPEALGTVLLGDDLSGQLHEELAENPCGLGVEVHGTPLPFVEQARGSGREAWRTCFSHHGSDSFSSDRRGRLLCYYNKQLVLRAFMR